MTSKGKTRAMVNLALSVLLAASALPEARAAGPAPLPREMRLEYMTPPGAGCPSAEFLEQEVVVNALRDPFNADARAAARITIKRDGAGFSAGIQVRDSGAVLVLDRPVPRVRSCLTLVRDVGFILGDMLRPRLEREPAPPPTPPPVQPAAPAAAPPKPAPREPLSLHLGLAGALELRISAPIAGFNLVGDVGIRWRAFSVAAELRWAPPRAADLEASPGAWMQVMTFSEGAVLCGHVTAVVSPLFCALGRVTEAPAWGSAGILIPSPAPVSVEAGGRIGADVALPWMRRRFAVRLAADVMATLWGASYHVVGQPSRAWTSSRVTFALGAGFIADVPLN